MSQWWVVQITKAQMPERCYFLPSPQEHHEEDFFLYIAYSDESVYGREAAAPKMGGSHSTKREVAPLP